jgi:hypothetical protein
MQSREPGNAKEALKMIAILFAGLLIALAAYFMLTKAWGKGPPKAKKQEKAEILRQLLALSEQENGIPATAPPVRPRTPPAKVVQASKHDRSRRRFVTISRKS